MKSRPLFCPVCDTHIILGKSEYRICAFDRPRFTNFYMCLGCLKTFNTELELNEFLLNKMEEIND